MEALAQYFPLVPLLCLYSHIRDPYSIPVAANVFWKGPHSKYFQHSVSVATTQLSPCI